eukprot:gene21351-29312_t
MRNFMTYIAHTPVSWCTALPPEGAVLASGGAALRSTLPAFRHGSLPEGGRIVGVARDDLSDEAYRALIKSRFDQVELAK